MLKSAHISYNKAQNTFLKSKAIFLTLDSNIKVFAIITTNDSSLISILDTFIKDTLLSNEFKTVDSSGDSLEFVLSKVNHFVSKLKLDIDKTLSISLGVIIGNHILFSILGNDNYLYIVKPDSIEEIAQTIKGKYEFSSVSSGKIDQDTLVIFSNIKLDDYLRFNDFEDITTIPSTLRQVNVIKNILTICNCNVNGEVIVSHQELIEGLSHNKTLKNKNIINILINYLNIFLRKISNFISKIELKDKIKKISKDTKNIANKYPKIKIGLLTISTFILIFLLFIIVNSIINKQINQTTSNDSKTLLLETKLLIEDASKELGNEQIFKNMIKNIESNITKLSNKEVFKKNIDEINLELSALKKEFFDIESVDLSKIKPMFTFDEGFSIVNIIRNGNKYYFVGKTSFIGPFIEGGDISNIPKYTYLENESIINADITRNGKIYLFTKSNRVLQFMGDRFAYVKVQGQDKWEPANKIHTFNNNIYLLSKNNNQILTHRPGIKGFSESVPRIKDVSNLNILDFAIDGGIYLLKDDLSINKLITSPKYENRSIRINKLPNNYEYINKDVRPKLFVREGLKYVYLLLDSVVWIFETDSPRFQDVRNLTYAGQIESIGSSSIKSLYIPRDGKMLVSNDIGVYQVDFEIVDGKISLR